MVTRSRGEPGTLGDVLAGSTQRSHAALAAVGIGLIWDEADDLPDPALDSGRALHLYRIVRVAIRTRSGTHRRGVCALRVRALRGDLRLNYDDGSGAAARRSAGWQRHEEHA